jgi:hypothetical protein
VISPSLLAIAYLSQVILVSLLVRTVNKLLSKELAPSCFIDSLLTDSKFKTIEVRVNQQGVKAKWVRIELRKVEVLPGGGQVGTFSDFVGPSPVSLWTAKEGDYDILRPASVPSLLGYSQP